MEDGGTISSDEEEENPLPRKDIDQLDISTDDFGGEAPQRVGMGQLPVRAARKEHQERRVGYNTDASTGTLAKIPEPAESTGQRLEANTSEHTTPKLKREPKDVAAKTEESGDDESMSDAIAGLSHAPTRPARKQDTQAQGVEHRSKSKGKGLAEPTFQTEEDRAEWERIQFHRSRIVAELGPGETAEVDGSGDTVMADAASTAKKPTVRDNNVYYFQFPPLMPDFESSVKKEAPEPKVDAKIKLEEGGFSDPSAKPSSVRFASGLVGKLRVHKSGRTTLDWGGTSFEVEDVFASRGSHQEVVSLEVTPVNQRSAPEDAGDAFSLGQVKGKFVVTPDLDAML
ncbi:rna polymerase iii rpc4 [Pyrenophora seminiperda CCB06]|uniref:Rna polymerase iii rpc4 n=1 Tax=Pyrenophora seminiperda CCB06 TaxID=1302712 RepID=A0A3M7M9M7_9PLEO|nr:rna polymerase iii rpc4 [Pyrenophora seminiperda CCB06]